MEDDKNPPKDNNKQEQEHKPKADDRIQTTCDEHQIENKNDQQVQTELTISPKETISIIVGKTEENLATNKEQLIKLKISSAKPETSGRIHVHSMEIFNYSSSTQGDTLKPDMSIVPPSDASINNQTPIKELKDVKNILWSIVRSIQEMVYNPNLEISDVTNRIEIHNEGTSNRNQLADVTKQDSASIPSTNYETSSKETSSNKQKEVSLTTYLDYTPAGFEELPTADFYHFKVEEEEDTTPVNRNVIPAAKKILMQSTESQKDDEEHCMKRYIFRTKGEKKGEDPTPLVTNVWPKRKSLNDIWKNPDEATISVNLEVDNSQNSENISVRNDSAWTTDASPNENKDITPTSPSTQLESFNVDQDADKTESSAFESAVSNLDNTNPFESVSSESLKVEQDNTLQVTVDTASNNDDSVKFENIQNELESTDQDTTSLDNSNSTTLLYDPSSTYPFHGAKEDQLAKPFSFDWTDKKKQEKDLLKKEDDLAQLRPEIEEKMCSLKSSDKEVYKPAENKVEVLLPLPKTSKFDAATQCDNEPMKLDISEKSETSMDQKLLMQFPSDWSTLSDFNIESEKTRKILHSTPIREISIQGKVPSMHPEHSNADKTKPPSNTQQKGKPDKDTAFISPEQSRGDKTKLPPYLQKQKSEKQIASVRPDHSKEDKTMLPTILKPEQKQEKLISSISSEHLKIEKTESSALLQEQKIGKLIAALHPEQSKEDKIKTPPALQEQKIEKLISSMYSEDSKGDKTKSPSILHEQKTEKQIASMHSEIPKGDKTKFLPILQQEKITEKRITSTHSEYTKENKTKSPPILHEQKAGKQIVSMHPEQSKEIITKSPSILHQEQKPEKWISKSSSSSSTIEELSDEDTKFFLDKTGSKVDWVWLPANKFDFVMPSACCYQILPGEDTHSDASSWVDEDETDSSKEVSHMASGDASTEENITFALPHPQYHETFIEEGPEVNKGEVSSNPNKTFYGLSSDLNKPSKPSSSHADNVTFKTKSNFNNKGWDIKEKSSSFFSLNPLIHGFYDLYDIVKYSPSSIQLSTIYEVSESDRSASISHFHVDAAQQAKIHEFAEKIIEAQKNESLYYGMGSVMTCVSENPISTIDEFFVLGKYKLSLDGGSDSTNSTLKPEVDDLAKSVSKNLQKDKKNSNEKLQLVVEPEFVSSSTSDLHVIKEEILADADLEMFCKQELDKFPKDNLGIRFKQLVKFNGKILFDCRCNYKELPLKLRRKYEGQEYLLLEFHHLTIPKQRRIFFSLHCCRHTIEEMLQIICITGKNKYIHPVCVKNLVDSYRTAYANSQLTHTSETLPCPIMQPKFLASVIDENSKNKFVQDWLNTSKAVAEKQMEESSTSSSRVPKHYTELSEGQEEPFINLLELEESANIISRRLTPHHTLFDERKEDGPEKS